MGYLVTLLESVIGIKSSDCLCTKIFSLSKSKHKLIVCSDMHGSYPHRVLMIILWRYIDFLSESELQRCQMSLIVSSKMPQIKEEKSSLYKKIYNIFK